MNNAEAHIMTATFNEWARRREGGEHLNITTFVEERVIDPADRETTIGAIHRWERAFQRTHKSVSKKRMVENVIVQEGIQ